MPAKQSLIGQHLLWYYSASIAEYQGERYFVELSASCIIWHARIHV